MNTQFSLRWPLRYGLMLLLWGGVAVGAEAQDPPDSVSAQPPQDTVQDTTQTLMAFEFNTSRRLQTRKQLEELLDRLELASGSAAYDGDLRERARYEAALVRHRLQEGDFQVGDRILLRVDVEEALSDTFVVQEGRMLDLPEIGDVPLSGVLRAELEGHLTDYLARFLRDPVVRARSLVRLAVLGAVNRPGFYFLPSESLVDDALMTAGGPSTSANITDIRIERGEDPIWEGDPLQDAIVEGRTIDQLNLLAGDRILIPDSGAGGPWATLRNISLLLGVALSVIFLTRAF